MRQMRGVSHNALRSGSSASDQVTAQKSDTAHAREGVRPMPLLFSYGSLQEESVQMSTFGRLLSGGRDELVGFTPSLVTIQDEQVVATIGKTHHANVVFSGDHASRVAGMVFEVSESELARVDTYEIDFSYRRISTMLASGREAWVYVHMELGVRRK